MLLNRILAAVGAHSGKLVFSRGLFILAAALSFGCSGEPPLVCESAPEETVGAWTRYAGPTYEHYALGETPISGKLGTDGTELLLLELECYDCKLARFTDGVDVWEIAETEHTSPAVPWRLLAMSEQHIAVPSQDSVAILNRSSLSWNQIERPSGVPSRENKGWTGEEFAYWGGAENLSGSLQLTSETLYRRHYDGVFLNPETLAWTLIPPLREAYDHTVAEGGPSVASIWTSKGLFVWGTNPERTANFGAIFDRESMSWTELETEGELPPLRLNHQLITINGGVYLFSGNQPGEEESSRRIFRYSLEDGTWREIAVPEWVDPMRGTVVAEKLVFMGRCAGGARFDPATETWEALATGGPRPTQGSILGFGHSVAVVGAEDYPVVSGRVWILDLGE